MNSYVIVFVSYFYCISQAYPQNELVQYRAIYNYTAQHYDELTFDEGDIINVSFDWLEAPIDVALALFLPNTI